MRILVTGGAGFIGSNLVRKALELGHQILNVDALTYAGNLDSLASIAHGSHYQFARIDLADVSGLSAAIDEFRPESIIHLAAESHVDRSIDDPWQFIQTNIVGTYHLLQVTLAYFRNLDRDERERFRLLHVSTDEVFGSIDEGLFTEKSPYDPQSPYAASKAASDHLVRSWHNTYGLPVLVTNCGNNYGPYQSPEKLVPTVILNCLRRKPIPIYGNGENIRDWLFVDDHCDALLKVLEKGRVGQTYMIGGSNPMRNLDLVHLLCNLVDELNLDHKLDAPSRSRIELVADRPGHDRRYSIDASKIRTELGWQPMQDPLEGFRHTVQWYVDNRAWWEGVLLRTNQLDRRGVVKSSR